MNKTTCSIPQCSNKKYGKGWCSKHYQRWRSHGDPLAAVKTYYSDPEEAFSARVEPRGKCIVWTGSKTPAGYGNLRARGLVVYAHRYAWERVNGPIPDGALIGHKCHNRSCVKVSHLRLANSFQNRTHLRGANKNNKSSGVRNVYKVNGRWIVYIKHNYKLRYLGSYDSSEEAQRIAEFTREKWFGEYAGKS